MTDATQTVVIERRIAARPVTVFSLLTDADQWLRWQGTEATIDPRPGGVFRVNVRGDGFASGSFIEVVPNARVVFTWGWEGRHPGWEGADHPVRPGSTTVTIDLEPDGYGTLLRLTHSGLPSPFDDLHRRGWEHYLGRLTARAEAGDPGPDPRRVTTA